MGRVNVRDGFWVLLAALWCVDGDKSCFRCSWTAALRMRPGTRGRPVSCRRASPAADADRLRRGFRAGRASPRPLRLRGSQSQMWGRRPALR
ncbi:MAG: hypothetical protein ACLR4Z_06500 [Butyricicoccaceae bacterium]